MKKLMCVTGALCAFLSIALFAVQAQKTQPIDEDVIEETDTFAIPLDTSSDEDEATLAKLKELQKKAQEKPEAVKKVEEGKK